MHLSRSAMIAWLALASLSIPAATAAPPENLALKATASATSEHSQHYLARFAIDGKIPPPGSSADLDTAWCVLKPASGDKAEFTLAWPQPIVAAEIIYWGRTAFYMNECWKDYEVYLDDAAAPAAKGTLAMAHGPQRISLQAARIQKLRLKFLNFHGGPNAGASEIQVFSAPLPETELARLTRQASSTLVHMPWVETTDATKLRALIERLSAAHGNAYHQHAEHLALLERLEQARQTAANEAERSQADAALEELERQVLLFDIPAVVAIRRHEIDATHVYTYHYEGFRPGGGLWIVSLASSEAKTPAPRELVASPTGQILDCDLSYDGRTILFSWRRTENEGYHLWTVDVDGKNLRRLTDGVWHDYNGCWLPDGGIVFLSTRSPQFAYCWHAPVGILHRMDADGKNVRQLSGNYLNDFTPAVLDDGRLLYTRWEYVDRPAIPIQSLWTLNPDGTGLSVFFGNRVLSPGTFMEARQIPGTTKIVCTMTGHNGPTRGAIGVVDRERGVNAQAAIENITPDVPVPAVNEGNGNTGGTKQYSGPWPLDQQRLLVSIRGPLLVRTFDGACQAIALDAPDDGMQWLAARPLAPRTPPPAIPSTLPAESDRMATLFLQDVYNGLAPEVRRGEVERIRVVRELPKTVRIDPSLRAFGFQFPVISCGATYAGKQVLGDAAVAPDGSAAFRVPAGVPLYFMALDAHGRAVQRMRSFTHLMPGETQGCVGCHEDRLQTSRPHLTLAGFRAPQELEPPEWGTAGFDYSRVVQPVLDKYCADCHNPVDAPGGVDLTGGKTDFFNVSYDVLAREKQGPRGSPFVSWIPTYNGQEANILEVRPRTWGSPRSKLADLVLNGHPDEKGQPRVAMDDTSRRRIFAWIDLNVPYYGSSETAYPELEGCRRILPADLEKVLTDVAARRCATCHKDGKLPRREWVRITEPEFNGFLLAPLARTAGGSERCGQAIFADKQDPDYQKILATFVPVTTMLSNRPRMDMPGGKPAPDVCRICQ